MLTSFVEQDRVPIQNTGGPAIGRIAGGKGDRIMASRLMPREPSALRAAKRARRGPGLAISLPLAGLVLAGGALMSPPAEAASLCGDRDTLLKRLEQSHEETPQALGLSADGGVLEVLVAPDGGWTILVTYPKRPTCVVAVGEAWQTLELTGGESA
jgi:hypothetical protein